MEEKVNEKKPKKKNRKLALSLTLIYVVINICILLVVSVQIMFSTLIGMLGGLTSAGYDISDFYGIDSGEITNDNMLDIFLKIVSETIKNSAIFIIICAVIFMLILLFVVIRPLKAVQTTMRVYQEDKDSSKVVEKLSQLRSRNEIGVLADDTVDLVRAVDAYVNEIESLTREKERIQTELDIAKQVQLSQLPDGTMPDEDNFDFDIYASMKPAKLVGGDFYDFFRVDDDHIALVIADVSDKGIPAALFMMVSKALIASSIKMGESPASALSHINRQLSERNEADMFVTVWLAVIELSTGKCMVSNAGHEHPVVLRKGQDGWEYVKYQHSPGVAMWEFAEFDQHEFMLNPGDSIFVYTDGVLEAINSEGEQYGYDRLIVVLNRGTDSDAKTLVESVDADISGFVGDAEQFDDITMLEFNLN